MSLSIDPAEIEWETGVGIKFTVKIDQQDAMLPENAVFEWNFDDGTVEEKALKPNQTGDVFTYVYSENGNYNVKVSLVNTDTDEVLAAVISKVIIDDLLYINKTNRLSISFWAFILEETGSELNGVYEKTSDYNVFRNLAMASNANWSFEWIDKNSFSVTFDETLEEGQRRALTMQGLVSDDASTLRDVTISWYYRDNNYNGPGEYWEWERHLTLVNIPISKSGSRDNVSWNGTIEGPTVQQHVSEYVYNSISIGELGERGDKKSFSSGFNWNTPDIPKIEVHFSVAD